MAGGRECKDVSRAKLGSASDPADAFSRSEGNGVSQQISGASKISVAAFDQRRPTRLGFYTMQPTPRRRCGVANGFGKAYVLSREGVRVPETCNPHLTVRVTHDRHGLMVGRLQLRTREPQQIAFKERRFDGMQCCDAHNKQKREASNRSLQMPLKRRRRPILRFATVFSHTRAAQARSVRRLHFAGPHLQKHAVCSHGSRRRLDETLEDRLGDVICELPGRVAARPFEDGAELPHPGHGDDVRLGPLEWRGSRWLLLLRWLPGVRQGERPAARIHGAAQ